MENSDFFNLEIFFDYQKREIQTTVNKAIHNLKQIPENIHLENEFYAALQMSVGTKVLILQKATNAFTDKIIEEDIDRMEEEANGPNFSDIF